MLEKRLAMRSLLVQKRVLLLKRMLEKRLAMEEMTMI